MRDKISGLADSDDQAFTLHTVVPDGTETANAKTDSRKVCDVADNCAMAGPVGGNKVDKKDPEITITTPTDPQYKLDEDVTADYSCIDDGSDMGSCDGTVPDGDSIETSSIDEKTFTVKATDKSGNRTIETLDYDVIYDFRLLDPIEDTSTLYTARAGAAVIVPFSVGGYQGTDIFTEDFPRSERIECGSNPTPTTIRTSNLRYDAETNLYTYAWNTDQGWSGTCRRLILGLKDGKEYSVAFRLE